MRKVLLIFLTVMFVSSSLLVSLSQQFTAYTRPEIKKIDPELMGIKSLKSGEKVKVIVWLNGNKSSESFKKIGRVKYQYKIIPAVAMEVPVSELENLAKESNVEKIVPDRMVSAFRLESMAIIKANNASSTFGVNGTGINISIVDTGIFNHTEFQSPNRIVKQKCYCNFTLNCCPDGTAESDNATDDYGHGTHCAGIVAGKGDGSGYGVATNASLFAVKVMNSVGQGSDSDVVAGIDWSVQNGANIISLSLGGSFQYQCYDFSSSEAVDNATKQGVVVVIAAGNSGPSSQTIGPPGCAKRAITVGNTNDNDNIASNSSRGPTKDNRTKPDLTAPGSSITSTYNDGSYATLSGTSMSTPHVAGVAALLIQRFYQINSYYPNPDRVKAILITAVNTTGMTGYTQRNNDFGSGRTDAYEALRIINFTKNNTISAGQEHQYKINVTSADFKTTLYWPEDENTNNNLNLIIKNSTNNISYPTDPNDTVEQVFVTNASTGYWDVYIDCINGTNQTYYLASNMEIFEDITPPVLILIKPENTTYTNRTGIPLNFSTDSTNQTIWYRLNGGNETVVTGNTTFNVSSDGQHNITLYVNDSYNNINQSTQYFSVDSAPPIIYILSPVSNSNYTTTSIWFNVSLNENGNVSLCSIDVGSNFTLTGLNGTYFYNLSIIAEGYHNVTFYVNDSVDWVNSSSVNFTIMIQPNITNSNVDNRLILLNENVNISANIDDDNLNYTWVNITWPNGISVLSGMSNSFSSYYYVFNETNQTGNYNVTIFSNDTFGSYNNASVNFTVANAVNVSSAVTNGSTSVNVSVKIFYNGTSQIRNQTINTSFGFIIPGGLWDLEINTTLLNVTLFNTNLTQNVTRDIKFNDNIQVGNISSNVNTLKTIALKFDNFTFSTANLTFFFNSSLVNNSNNLNVYKCDDWNFTGSNCSTSWVGDSSDTTFNATINYNNTVIYSNVTLITLNFSAFSLGENQSTTTTTTTTTTIAATTTTESSGDSGSDSTTTTMPSWMNRTQVNLYLNGTQGNFYYLNNSYANLTVTVNVTGGIVNLKTNMTGWAIQTDTTPLTNLSIITCSDNKTYYNITGWFNQTANYTSDSETYYAICYVTTTTNITTTTTTILSTTVTTTIQGTTTTTTTIKEEKIAAPGIKNWYVIPIVVIAIMIVVVWYIKYYKEAGEDVVFKRLKQKWHQQNFVVNFSFT
jgi:serine protease AprX